MRDAGTAETFCDSVHKLIKLAGRVGRLAVKFRSDVPLPAVTARTNLPWEKAMGSTLKYRRTSFYTALLLALTGLTGCASVTSTAQQSAAEPVANATTPAKTQSRPHHGLAIARDMVGTPYRYGGADPRGFDCSGLVYYSYRKASIEVPRTAAEQYRQSTRVKISRLRSGDLIFFRISRDKLSHVGIYAGSGRFIHAPWGAENVYLTRRSIIRTGEPECSVPAGFSNLAEGSSRNLCYCQTLPACSSRSYRRIPRSLTQTSRSS